MEQGGGFWVVRVPSGTEFVVADRIAKAGYATVCPQYMERLRPSRGRVWVRASVIRPLFPTYIFVRHDPDFRPAKFETTRIRLQVFRSRLVTDAEMTLINEVAMERSVSDARGKVRQPIKRGDVMELLHGILRGEPVDVLHVRKERIIVQLRRKPSAVPIEVRADSLGALVA